MRTRAATTVTWGARIALALAGLLALAFVAGWCFLRASLAQLDGSRAAPGLTAAVQVARDAGGVPLIRGGDRLDVAYATGFVHAQERFFQMDTLRRVAAGELAEWFGPRALALDQVHRLHRFRRRAESAWGNLAPDERRLLARYADGVNAGLDGLAARPFEYALLGAAPKAWSPTDSLLVIWAMYFDLQGGQGARKLARGWLREHASAAQLAFLLPVATQWDAPLDGEQVAAPSTPIPAAAPDWWGGVPAPQASRSAGAGAPDVFGSNNWAVAGQRSRDGAAIVSNDMHLGLQLPNIWYRLALQFPLAGGSRRVVGVSLPGAPLVVAGSNGQVAWGFTNSYGDYFDLVELGVDPARPGRLRTPAGWERPALHEETILVKGAPAHQLLVRDTSLGPVQVVAGRSYALHWVAHGAPAVNLNLRRMEAVDSVAAALAAAATFGVPAQNLVVGDARGHIGWTVAGPLPRRAEQDAGAPDGFPIGLDDARAPWQGWLAPAEYPRRADPADGQISTANSRPLMGAQAALLGDGGFDLGARGRQVRDALRALGPRTDVAAVYGVSLDDRARFLDDWRRRALVALDEAALAGRPRRAEFRRLLEQGWSGRASVDAAGYRLARGFLYALYDVLFDGADRALAGLDSRASVAAATSRWPVALARLLDERPAGWLPARHPSWQALQLEAIDRAIDDLGRDGAALADATWGARNRAAIAHPIAIALPWLRPWLSAPADPLPGDSNMPRVAGPRFGQSERLTVSPGQEERGVFNMPGGQSGHPLSPFFLDGHAAWVSGRPTPLLPGPAAHTLTFLPSRERAGAAPPR